MHDGLLMERRLLLQRAALLIGATTLPIGDLLAAPAKNAPPALSAPQLELLSAVADTIVPVTDTPGALAANVPALVDAMLRDWAAPATRTSMIEALDRIDVAARAKTGNGFTALSPDERLAVLKPHDTASLKPKPSKPSTISPRPETADPGYAKLKELIVVLYYQSEIALTTELTYEHAPGKWQPSIPLTPETRQTGGLTAF
jgi:gluconate 2-dehydrogenase gamma chain